MKLTHSSLAEYTSKPFDASPSEVKDLLNQMGAEVEGITETDNDHVFDIDITPNRPDWLGVVGLAREITSAVRDDVGVVLKSIDHDYSTLPTEAVAVELARQEDCPRYFARLLENIQVGESPDWLKRYLQKIGYNSVNNVVDLMSFVMHETGHPLHAFDAEKISGQTKVRNACKGEKLQCLDGELRDIPEGSLVISDDSDAVLAVAGIIGGESSQVTESTSSIVIESAYFDPVKVRKAAKGMQLSTEASFRFERGADTAMPQYALDRASDLVGMYAQGSPVTNFTHDILEPEVRKIELRVEQVSKILGVKIEQNFIASSLTKLGFIVDGDEGTLEVTVPSWRMHDVKFEACLIEEVGKVFGYDNIPNVMPKVDMNSSKRSEELDLKDGIEKHLVHKGFNQVVNFGFISPGDIGQFQPSADSYLSKSPRLQNPLNQETSIMRPSLVPGLVGNYNYNFDRGARDIRFFEIGHTFNQESPDQIPEEKRVVSGLVSGSVRNPSWADKPSVADFYSLKSTVYGLLADLGIDPSSIEMKPSTDEVLEPGQGADLFVGDKKLGFVGNLKDGIVKKHKQRSPVIVFELDMDKILDFSDTSPTTYDEISKFPSVDRDIALVCDQSFQSKLIEQEIVEVGGDLVRQIKLFDVYQGKGLPNGKVSLAFNIQFNSSERSLTNEEIAEIMQTILSNLKDKHGIEVRQ